MIALPIDPHLPEILASLEKGKNLVLQAAPGTGKTTRVPPALLTSSWRSASDEILVLEPRRLAAKYAARRVAEEFGEEVGQTIGYHFRFENVSGAKTRVRFLTEGMLFRRLLGDPKLSKIKAVILDEFHERHLHGDIALGYLRHLQRTTRPDLRLVVMSATLDSEKIAAFLEGPTISIAAKRFPVDISYLPGPAAKPFDVLVREAVQQAMREKPTGDILVFLPGMYEIRKCESALSGIPATVFVLHGELAREEQDRALQKADRRKVILSTNVAETSLTIEGVEFVIDSGLHRQASYSWWSGVPALKTRATSRASAEQRAGRAGRTAPGKCFRLYSKHEYDTRPQFDVPEIHRADLAQTVLELKAMGVDDLRSFPWFEAPKPGSLEGAVDLLYRLGAMESREATSPLTAIGKRLVEIPTHPRLGRMLLEAEARGTLETAAGLAAAISEGRLDRLDALEFFDDKALSKAKQQLLSSFPAASRSKGNRELVAQCVLAGFPDRVARKRSLGRGECELVLSSGGSARAKEDGVLAESTTFVALDIQEQKTLRVHSVCAIDENWLFDVKPSPLKEIEEVKWDKDRQRVLGSSRLVYDQLTLLESKGEIKDAEAATKVLLKEGLGVSGELSLHQWIEVLRKVTDVEAFESAIGRLLVLGVEANGIEPALRELIASNKAYSLASLKELDWPSRLADSFPEIASKIHRLAPLSIDLPSGRKTKINYPINQPPWIASRLQDFFGMTKGPTILDGKMPLQIHLLAPNQRAVQVTMDLAGFWERGYPAIRKELSRKYPRHKWPENPFIRVS